MVADAARREFVAVAGDVVLERLDRERIRAAAKPGKLRFVLLVGGANPRMSSDAAVRRRSVPTHLEPAKVVDRWGPETEIASDDLQQLAEDTRGQYFPVRKVSQLRSIYEDLARRLGESYTLTYRTDRRLPDGTLRPVSVAYRESSQAAQAQLYVRGMIVPAGGWSRLFLALLAVLAVLSFLPSWRSRRHPRSP